MKRTIAVVLMIIVMMLLCSCSDFGINFNERISPPKPSGELYEIQKILEASVGEGVTLVYPYAGQYRSAIITKDIDGDGRIEVIAFYSTETDDKTTVMHINYIRWNKGKWQSVSDLQIDCSAVESVDFVRLDKSTAPKVVVKWNRFSPIDKYLSVYSIDSGVLEEVVSADYSVVSICDFENDGISEIVAIYLDSKNDVSTATLLSLEDKQLVQKSQCELDGTITSYYEPVFSKLVSGTPALFVDANKSTGVITEVLYLKEGKLVSAINRNITNENSRTLRASTILSKDIDGDGCVDIPLTQKLPLLAGGLETDSVYVATWNKFDGYKFEPIVNTVTNFADGYSLTIPENWMNSFTIVRNTELRIRTFIRWDSELNLEGEEFMRIQVVSIKEWENNQKNFENFNEITRDSENVYAVKFGNSALNPGIEYIKNNFVLLQSDKVTQQNNLVRTK